MLVQNFATLITSLQKHRMLLTDDDWHNWLETIEQLSPAQNASEVAQLFALFSDDVNSTDAMWPLLHQIETNDLQILIGGFIRAAEQMQSVAPNWLNTCNFRLLNDDEAKDMLCKLIHEFPTDETQPLRGSLHRLAQTELDFAERITFVLL